MYIKLVFSPIIIKISAAEFRTLHPSVISTLLLMVLRPDILDHCGLLFYLLAGVRVLEINSFASNLKIVFLSSVEGVDGLIQIFKFNETNHALLEEADLISKVSIVEQKASTTKFSPCIRKRQKKKNGGKKSTTTELLRSLSTDKWYDSTK